MNKRYQIGIMIGNVHTDHPWRLLRRLHNLFLNNENTDAHFYIGTESGSLLRGISPDTVSFDYQYYSLNDYSRFVNLDLIIVSYGTIMLENLHETREQFLDHFKGIPVVMLEDTIDESRGTSIIADNYSGITKCVEHLITVHELEKILFIKGPEGNRDAEERLNAYIDTMNSYGIHVEDSMIGHGDFSENIDNVVEKLLSDNPDAEAIVSSNDDMLASVYRVFKKHGIRPGADIAVTGFDNVEMASYIRPPLTTVWQDPDRMADMAYESALEILDGKMPKPKKFPVELIVRASCGCPFSEKDNVNSLMMDSLGNRDVIDVVTGMKASERKSWLVPAIIRSLLLYLDDRRKFLLEIGNQLENFGAKNSYIFSLINPREVEEDVVPPPPDCLTLALRQNGDEIVTYLPEERPVVEAGQFSDTIPDDGKNHSYMSFLLFDGKIQYGVLKTEIDVEDVPVFYLIALQLGIAFRFLQMNEKESVYKDELKMRNAQLAFQATHDVLTGILNRQGVMSEMKNFVESHPGVRLTVIMADLDHLKQINDTFGHGAGDSALKTLAGILIDVIVQRHGGVAGRTGGDEFAGVFVSEGMESSHSVIDEIHKESQDYNDKSTERFFVDISAGCADFMYNNGSELHEMLHRADMELYNAKKTRRESVIRPDKK